MLFIRPVKLDDLDALLRMSVEVGTGMTSMPNNEDTWLVRIKQSQDTFASKGNPDKEGVYFMVAEDIATGKVVGTTAIYVGVGTVTPFFSYKKTLIVKYSRELKKTIETPVLNLVNDYTRSSEIGSLFLSESHRHSNYGQFMSRSRYLLLADFPQYFAHDVIAEMRGYQDKEGKSAFWQALGKKFFDLPFENADYISATKGSQFIQDLMPKYPVYTGLLSEEAQECIGKSHAVSAKAIHMLEKEGFRYNGYVDVFDGGPTVHCRREQIQSVRDTHTYNVKIVDKIDNENQRYLISNKNKDNYKITIQSANLNDDNSQPIAEITQQNAEILGVSNGQKISVLSMYEKSA